MLYIISIIFALIGSDQRQHLIHKELEYYLQRHNVQDEGFDMVARYAEEGDSTMTSFAPKEKFAIIGNQSIYMSNSHKRIVTDMYGRIIIGTFSSDTLVSGIRIDSLGTYSGQFNRYFQACGHGSYQASDGSYYEGHWERDLQHGFGFRVSTDFLQAGRWKYGQFLGERMLYTSERIYGIDISRYQHEKGRKRFTINWQSLRIIGLGRRISEKRIYDKVDYPVSFIFIKSTQGTSITNRYFLEDYRQCRKHNIKVGAYHYFSTKEDPRLQADFFLEHTKFSKGDLPPILDLEPSDKLVEQMGGEEILFHNVRIWLEKVEKQTQTKPIIYVNQRFINTWMTNQKDLLSDYQFWVARYGEYKPYFHLALWQLSEDGKVRGIQGPVDINVFNGYQGQWKEFLETNCIKTSIKAKD